MDLSDHETQRRLDLTTIPPPLAHTLSNLDVSITLVERVETTGIGWAVVEDLLARHAIQKAEDLSALVTLLNAGLSGPEIDAWASLGRLEGALRLHLKNVPLETVKRFPLSADTDLMGFVRMVQTVQNTGIHIDDLWWWHTSGVITLSPPYLNEPLWAAWRSVAALHLGMTNAALAAAAGLSAPEAVEMWNGGQIDTEGLQVMAGLRSGLG